VLNFNARKINWWDNMQHSYPPIFSVKLLKPRVSLFFAALSSVEGWALSSIVMVMACPLLSALFRYHFLRKARQDRYIWTT
jgi:hypothetical protein